MEKRIANIIISKPGGTASFRSKAYKLSLPTKWIKDMGINEFNRQVEISFDGEKISISKKLSLDDFINKKKEANHILKKFVFYDNDKICSIIAADFTDNTISSENLTKNYIKTAFGKNEAPIWSDFENFLEERCIPRQRSGLREYLEALSIDSYNPLEIIKKTNGRMEGDNQWIKTEDI